MPEACFVYLLSWKLNLAYFARRLIRGRYEAVMVGRCAGLRRGCRTSEVFVCTSWFLRLNGYRILADGLDQNSRPGRAPCPPGKIRWDSKFNISANEWAVYWDDTCSVVLAVNLGTIQSLSGRVKKKMRRNSELMLRSGSDWNMGSNRGYKCHTLYLVLRSHEQRKHVFTSSLYPLSVFSDTHIRWLWWQPPWISSLPFREVFCSVCARYRRVVYNKPRFHWACECISVFACHALLVAARRHQFTVTGSERRSKSQWLLR